MRKPLILLLLLITTPAHAEPTLDTAFSPNRGATDLIVKTIAEAQHTICAAAYILTSHKIESALINARQRGVQIKLTLDKNQNKGFGTADFLRTKGIQARQTDHYAIMHDKFMVIDNATVELGSFNYTRAAEEDNAENLLVIHNAPQIAKAYATECDQLWTEAK